MPKNSKIIIVTNTYPYSIGEQFLEAEIKYWSEVNGIAVDLCPTLADGSARDTGSIHVNTKPGNSFGVLNSRSFKEIVGTLLSPVIIKEIKRRRTTFLNPRKVMEFYQFLLLAIRYRNALLDTYGDELGKDGTAVYCYWLSWQAMGAVLLKKRFPNLKVVARTHRNDVYEYASRYNYLPYRQYLCERLDRIYPISQDAANYLESHFSIDPKKITVARLGVNIAGIDISKSSDDSTIRVLSVSYVKPVKRVLLIAEMLESFATENSEIKLIWTHIGDGPLMEDLAQLKFSSNITVELLGQLPNPGVHKILGDEHFDIFINLSSSEGIPVTIMEAMSYGVPVLATAVGGVPEIVADVSGELLTEQFSAEDFISQFRKTLLKDREEVRKHATSQYDASKNYRRFCKEIINLKQDILDYKAER